MRIVFAGTPEFAACALEKLHAAGHEIVLVLTQPDRPAGRGMRLQASPVKRFALAQGLPIAQPRSLRLDGKYPADAAEAREALAAADAQAMVVAAYGLILPQWVLDAMEGPGRYGCLNIHGSLLPRWRGAAPIHRAIEAGDTETGITIMQMDAGLDTGAMLMVEAVPITHDGPEPDTTGSLHDKLAALGARMIVDTLERAAQGRLHAVAQPEAGVTYAHKIEKHEAQVDWARPADVITRRVRAFNPFPGAFSHLNGETVKIWAATVAADAGVAGATPGTIVTVLPDAIRVATGGGAVDLTELQRPGGKRLAAAELLRGWPLQTGQLFEAAAPTSAAQH
jgi:methionyl-tRNA formyltransferase